MCICCLQTLTFRNLREAYLLLQLACSKFNDYSVMDSMWDEDVEEEVEVSKEKNAVGHKKEQDTMNQKMADGKEASDLENSQFTKFNERLFPSNVVS